MVKAVFTKNKRKKEKDSSDSVSQYNQEHLNFETLNIGEEWQTARTPRINDAEITEEGTETEKELYTIINLINPTKTKKINITYLYY